MTVTVSDADGKTNDPKMLKQISEYVKFVSSADIQWIASMVNNDVVLLWDWSSRSLRYMFLVEANVVSLSFDSLNCLIINYWNGAGMFRWVAIFWRGTVT